MKNKDRRLVRAGELLAIDTRALIKGPDAFFWMFAPACPPMKRIGSTAIIYIRGALEHHADGYSCSYEQILEDARAAKAGDDENDPAKQIILSVDSPGGVVSGLYECVDALKKLGIPITAYVEGLCASAAYAMVCACDKIYCSRSAILGSIGVIATMYSQRRRDKAMGIDVVTITSGKRKADGHPHVAISDDAIRAEEKRVSKFASAFFALVEDARDFDPEPHEAGLFVGSDAVKAGYADAIKTLDEKKIAQSGTTVPQSGTTEEAPMRLTTLIDRTKAAIKAAKDPAEKSALKLRLAAYEQTRADTKKTYEHEKEVEETTDEPEEEEEESDDDDDGGGGNDTERDDAAEDEEKSAESEDDEEESESEDDEKKAAKALASLKVKGSAAKRAVALAQKALDRAAATRKAMRGELKGQRALAKQVAELAEANERRDRNAVIEGALASGRITPAEAKQLRKQSTDHVAAFLSARPKAIVRQGALSPDLKANPTMVSQSMNNFAPSDVTAEITAEMREAAERAEMLSGGKIKADQFLKDFQASVTAPKETH